MSLAAPNTDEIIPASAARGPWGNAWHSLRKDRLAMVCLVIVAVYLLAGVAAELGLIAGDAEKHVSGLEYQDADWGHAWNHFGWFGQTCLSTVLLVLLAAPFAYLRVGPNRRFLLVMGCCTGAALLLTGILHGVTGASSGTERVVFKAPGTEKLGGTPTGPAPAPVEGELLELTEKQVRIRDHTGAERAFERSTVASVRVARSTLTDDKLVVTAAELAALRARESELLSVADRRQHVVPVTGHSFTRHLLGADIFGRNIFSRALHGVAIAFKIGVMVTLMAIPIGVLLGAAAGYFGGVVDELVVWLYSTLASIPGLLLILAVGFALKQRGVPDIYVVYFALGTTTWITLCRLIRGEVLKHRSRDYVTAARALGAGNRRLLLRHILPNVVHIVIIRFSLQFIFAVQTEVVLSYLGVGIGDAPSWGRMIDDAKLELINGEFMNLIGATVALFGLALAFNVLGDSLRDALDPRLKE